MTTFLHLNSVTAAALGVLALPPVDGVSKGDCASRARIPHLPQGEELQVVNKVVMGQNPGTLWYPKIAGW